MWQLALAVSVLALAGCGPDGQPSLIAEQPRGASVAFDSIDGPPPEQFAKLVQDLNQEAKARRLAVVSRTQPSAYRVRGSLAVKIAKRQTTVSWVWDVLDQSERRALRISGEETVQTRHDRGWIIADDAMLKRIAHNSMDQLAAFLTSPDVMPNAPAAPEPAQVALIGGDKTPEAAGIFRIFKAEPAATDEYPTQKEIQPQPIPADEAAVPLSRQRPGVSAALSARKAVAVEAADGMSSR
jgi:hypothetical protein